MDVVQLELRGSIWWRPIAGIQYSEPLECLGGWSVVSPLSRHVAEAHRVELGDDFCLVSSNQLLLCSDEGLIWDDHDEFISGVESFLNALRNVARQSELPRFVVACIGPRPVDDLQVEQLLGTDTVRGMIRRYVVDSAVSVDHVTSANECVMRGDVRVHTELANDAAESTLHSNYRAAIIFAASAIESCAGFVLDREYDRLRTQPTVSESANHRLLTITVNKSKTVRKDPVYLALRNSVGEGGSRFLPLLHECPLYLLGKSLRIDDPDLYKDAHAVYKTRNSLAHTGTTNIDRSDLLPVDWTGALSAVCTANAVLEWFGERGSTAPSLDFVSIEPGNT